MYYQRMCLIKIIAALFLLSIGFMAKTAFAQGPEEVSIVSQNSRKCLDVSLDVTGSGQDDGANILQWGCHGESNQLWRVELVNNNYYKIVSQNSGKCLDVTGYSQDDGALIQQYTCHGGPNQLWELVSVDNNSYKIVSQNSGKCLDVTGYSQDDGALIQQYTCHGGPNQLWELVPADSTIIVDVYMKELLANEVTSESGLGLLRDEVYIQVFGETPEGNISVRLPRSRDVDDYYWFNANTKGTSRDVSPENWEWWRTSDEARTGEPRFWSGYLAPGRKAKLFIVIAEQDSRELESLSNALKAALKSAEEKAGDDPKVTGAIAGAKSFVDGLPDSRDDIIGTFYIELTNVAGQLATVWLPLKELPYRETRGQTTLKNEDNEFVKSLRAQGEEVMAFIFKGVVGGNYVGTAAVDIRRSGEPEKAHRYLITEFDACDPDELLRVYDLNPTGGYSEVARLQRGEIKPAPIPVTGPNWLWKCGDSWGSSRGANDRIKYLLVHRVGGSIRWYAFNNEDW